MMIYVHGNKSVLIILVLLFLNLTMFLNIEIISMKTELIKNIKLWELKSSVLEKNNLAIIQELES